MVDLVRTEVDNGYNGKECGEESMSESSDFDPILKEYGLLENDGHLREQFSARRSFFEDFYTKLSDFGLAKFGPTGDRSHVATRVMGTHGYCAPEYAKSGRLTAKSGISTVLG
ncbi:hypothetical protein ACLB2K_068172 [Fragaria x ananassa]